MLHGRDLIEFEIEQDHGSNVPQPRLKYSLKFFDAHRGKICKETKFFKIYEDKPPDFYVKISHIHISKRYFLYGKSRFSTNFRIP